MSKKERLSATKVSNILETTIRKLEVTPFVRNKLLGSLSHWAIEHKVPEEEITARMVIDFLFLEKGCSYYDSFLKCLEKMGLTYLDCSDLDPRTAKPLLKELDKNQLLELDVRVLDIFQQAALDAIGKITYDSIGSSGPATIGDLLKYVTYPAMTGHWGQFGVGFKKAYSLLKELGFKYEDGPFMQEGTPRFYQEQIAKKYKMSQKTAAECIRFVQGENLKRFPLEEN